MRFDNTFKTLIKMNLKSGVIPMLLGEVGIGKSCFVESLANEMDAEFFELSCNQLQDKKDVTGNALSVLYMKVGRFHCFDMAGVCAKAQVTMH